MPYPSYDDLLAASDLLPDHERLVVPPEFEDHNGHMNIAHYLTTASWGAEYAMRSWGVPADWVERDRLGMFSAEHHLRYFHEIHVGADISVRVRAVARSGKALHLHCYLLNHSERQLAYTMELLTVHVDMESRRSAAWPDPIAAALDAAITQHAALDWPVSGCLSVR